MAATLTPFLAAANVLDNTEYGTKCCAFDVYGARELEEKAFGGCDRAARQACTSLLESNSDVASLVSESETLWQRTASTIACIDDTCYADVGTSLQCEDTLDYDDDEDATREFAPGTQPAPSSRSSYFHEDSQAALGTELAKEQELGPMSLSPLPIEHRAVLVHWMMQVCGHSSLSHATFFSAVALLDRFVRRTSEGMMPQTLLQLLALTCTSMAAKNEQQCSAAELLSLAVNENGVSIYRLEDYRMMELHLFGVLEYRLRTPTIYTFACMFVHRVINRPQDGLVVPPGCEDRFRALVVRLAELAALDHELTAVPYSTLATACLLIAETEIKGGAHRADLKTVESLRTVPGLPPMPELTASVQRIYMAYKETLPAPPASASE